MSEDVWFTFEWYNTEDGREYQRMKREEFKERNKGYSRQKIRCLACNSVLSRANISHHKKTIKHYNAVCELIKRDCD